MKYQGNIHHKDNQDLNNISGMSYRSLLQKTNENFNHIYDALKSAYASYLELSIKVKNL